MQTRQYVLPQRVAPNPLGSTQDQLPLPTCSLYSSKQKIKITASLPLTFGSQALLVIPARCWVSARSVPCVPSVSLPREECAGMRGAAQFAPGSQLLGWTQPVPRSSRVEADGKPTSETLKLWTSAHADRSSVILVLPVDKGLQMCPCLSLEHDQKANQCRSTVYQGRGSQLDPNQDFCSSVCYEMWHTPVCYQKRC